jgi:hypothetical protein
MPYVFDKGGNVFGKNYTPTGGNGMSDIQTYFSGGSYALYDFRPGSNTIFSDTSCTTPILTFGEKIAGVKDLGNYGRNLTQATDAQKPLSRPQGASFYEASYSILDSSSAVYNVSTILVVGRYNIVSDSYGSFASNQADGAVDVDYAFTRNSGTSTWDSGASAGNGLASSTRIWNNKVQTTNITFNQFACYSADGTGHPGSLRFANGLRVGQDRVYIGRNLSGIIQSLFVTNTILSTVDRNWLEDKYSSIFSLGF